MASPFRSAATTVLLFSLLGLSRHFDNFVLLFLRQQTGESLMSALARNLRPAEAGLDILTLVGFGLSLWLALGLMFAWLGARAIRDELAVASRSFTPLLLPVGLTAAACLSVFLSPRFPYGVNLILTLAYEGSFASILTWGLLAISIARSARHALGPLPPLDLSARAAFLSHRAVEVALVLLATTGFACLTPSSFWKDGEGQGNMLKYLRMAATLAGSADLDIARAESAAREATPLRFLSRLPGLAGRCLGEARALLAKFYRSAREGKLYLGESRAEKANRAMFRDPEGGIYYINAPGPALLIVPFYLTDRSLNGWLGVDRQMAVILFWNFLGALLLLEMARAGHELTGHWGPALGASLVLGFAPPLLFYTYQVYPELPAALLLLYAFRRLLMDPGPGAGSVLLAAIGLGFLPWLHQKYSLTAAVASLLAAMKLLRKGPLGFSYSERVTRLGLLLVPLALSAFSILVYNHALTGSVLPYATFRAAGRSFFQPENLLRGSLGLLLDVENGLLVYAPVYLLAFAGAARLAWRDRKIYLYLLTVAASYMAVVGSFPYWPGAVSSVGRYMLSLAPLAVLPVAIVIRRAFQDGLVAGLALTFLAATLSLTLSFLEDRIPTYGTSLLLDRVLYSDPYQYLPNFQSEGWLGSGPAHFYKLAALAAGLGLLIFQLGPRISRERPYQPREGESYPGEAAAGAAMVLGTLLVGAVFLEAVPSNTTEKKGPLYRDSRLLRPQVEVAVDGKYSFEGEGVWVPGEGRSRFVIRSGKALGWLCLALTNGPRDNRVEVRHPGGQLVAVGLSSSERRELRLPLRRAFYFEGPEGREWIYRFEVRSRGGFAPRAEGRGQDTRWLGCFVEFCSM